MHLPVVVFLVAVTASVLARGAMRLRPPRPLPGRERDRVHIKVVFAIPIRHDWRDVLMHVLARARYPRRLNFGVLLECTRPEDADLGDVDADLRGIALVEHVRAPRTEDPARRIRRLARHFVRGDESVVVFLDPRTRVVHAWDATLTTLLRHAPSQAILSAPTSDRVPAFPTLRVRSTGSVARAPARAFEGPEAPVAVPSVCWCSEFTAGRPQAFSGWPRKLAVHSGAAQSVGVHVVPACTLVEANETLAEALLDDDEGCADMHCGAHERVGLTRDADDAECIQKFGSSRAARLALEFSR